MPVMPDILAPGLDVVFCGTAPGERSAARGHYFAGHGNRFWNFLHESGLTDELLAPEDDRRLPEFGIGLTDLVKDAAQSHDRGLDFSGTPELERRLLPAAPRWVAFAGITAGAQAVKVFGALRPRHGAQDWTVAGARVFVVTNPSGANARGPWDGREREVD